MHCQHSLVIFDEEFGYLPCQCVGLTSDFFIETVGEEGVELQSCDAAFREQGAVLLDEGEEMLGCSVVGEHDCFAEEGSDFRTSDVEGFAVLGEIFQGHVISFCSEGVAESGSVDEQSSVVFLGHVVDCREFLGAVHSAEFGGEGEVDQFGLHYVVAALVGSVCAEYFFQFVGPDLSVVVMGEGDYLVACEFNCAGFVDVDVAGGCGNGSLPGFEQCVDDSGVGLGAAYQEEDVCIGVSTGFADALLCALAVFVNAVGAGIFVVGLCQSFQDGRMHPAVIIAIEIEHNQLKK